MDDTVPSFVERRERTLLLRACPYRLTTPGLQDPLALFDGQAVSMNVSPDGMLLMMSEEPPPARVFEVLAPAVRSGRPSLALVEVRWTRPAAMDSQLRGWLVGVRFLLPA